MSKKTLTTLARVGAFVTPVLVFLYRHRATIAFVLEIIPDILIYACDPPPEEPAERDVTPAPAKIKKPRTRKKPCPK